MREDNHSNVKVVQDYTAYMDYMDLTVRCPRQAVTLDHSSTH